MTSSAQARKRVKQSVTSSDGTPLNGHAATPGLVQVEAEKTSATQTETSNTVRKGGHLSKRDRDAIILLVILYMLQGVPLGLTFGTMPYLLKTKLRYSDIGTFMLATYPYSIKLGWSPLVDSCWVSHVSLPIIGRVGLGRRKSWIVPTQFTVGIMLWLLGSRVDELLLNDKPPVLIITALFFTLVAFAATQDIAVDGWALTLLSQDNLSYASTAQTVGLNIGYFMSFTVFLALNSVEFGNKYLRSASAAQTYPVLSLSAYLKIASVAFVIVTLWLTFFKDEGKEEAEDAEHSEKEPSVEDKLGLRGAYQVIWRICKLKHVQMFLLIHLVAKIGFQANDAVTSLKLIEKGFSKEDLALAVLIDFPFQLVLGYFAARWSRGDKALTPWLWGYGARLCFAVLSMGIVAALSRSSHESGSSVGLAYFSVIIVSTVAGSFASTVQFVGISAFHTQIADPLIGGTYMTLLNTVSNLGGTWPNYFVLKAVDWLTISECRVTNEVIEKVAAKVKPGLAGDRAAEAAESFLDQLKSSEVLPVSLSHNSSSTYALLETGAQCATLDAAKQACRLGGGKCAITRDGYYIASTVCVIIGLALLILFILPQSKRLQQIGVEEWRLNRGSSGADVLAEGEAEEEKKDR